MWIPQYSYKIFIKDVLPGQDDPVLYIGVVEKGYALLSIQVQGEQHHSRWDLGVIYIGVVVEKVLLYLVYKYKENSIILGEI